MLERSLDQIGEVLRLYEGTNGILMVNRGGIIKYHRTPLNSYWCSQDAMGRHILKFYPRLSGESSTILTALRTGRASCSVLQDINSHRREWVLLEPTTVPIVVDGRVECVMDSSKYHTVDQRVIRGGEGGGLSTLDRILTEDPAMPALKGRVRDVVGLDSSVLVYGETGMGKELVAESLHSEGGRAGPFASQNCAAIPAVLLENLFFGTEKGSYTGVFTRKGLLEEADSDALFLDEVNSMDPTLQTELLEVLEEKEVRRLRDNRGIPFNVRIVAAVNEKPQKLIQEGRLREDPYYHLEMIRLTLPPLREQLCDIGPPADYFIEHCNRKLHRRVRGLSERALRLLRGYAWPGNVWELENAIEGAVAIAQGKRLTAEDMEEVLAGRLGDLNRPPELPEALHLEESFSLTRVPDSYKRELLSRAIQQTGSISQAARLLGLSRQSLRYKLEKFDL